ncbi:MULTISPECIES: hypothetical protein [unclassified Moraxella]|nr:MULTISPECIES: hypothetical protein [unclassified Moraxella]
MKYIFCCAMFSLLMFFIMELMLSAWDKEYEIERARIAEYKASLVEKR